MTSLIGGAGAVERIVIRNVSTNCPSCGGIAVIRDGEYRYASGIVTALRTASTESIEKLIGIVERGLNDGASEEYTASEVRKLNPSLERVYVEFLRFGGPSLLIAMLALWLQFSSMKDDDEASKALQEGLARQAQSNELIAFELKRFNDAELKKFNEHQSDKSSERGFEPEKSAASPPLNRHARRAAQRKGNSTA